jgi:predicted nucleic acid-binding protein
LAAVRKPANEAAAQAWDLGVWFSGRILAMDRQAAKRRASLVAHGSRTGKTLPTVDSLIAATALANDLTVVTRNTRDFEGGGVTTINPWEAAAALSVGEG